MTTLRSKSSANHSDDFADKIGIDDFNKYIKDNSNDSENNPKNNNINNSQSQKKKTYYILPLSLHQKKTKQKVVT